MYTILLQIQDGSNVSSTELVKHDPYGLFLSLVSIAIVMTVLVFVYLAFKALYKLIQWQKYKFKGGGNVSNTSAQANENFVGEVGAAIALAIYLYNKEIRDDENSVLTIKKITHHYTPWNSKIYAMRKLPEKV